MFSGRCEGLSAALFGVAAGLGGVADDGGGGRRTVSLPWRIYRHYPADFSRWREAAAGFRGWDSEVRELDVGRCCLALMHFPDRGLTPDSEWGPDCANPGYLGTVEWVPRTMEVVTFRMPRLIEAARNAGLLTAHVGVSGKFHMSGSVWERCVAEAGSPPPADADVISGPPAWHEDHRRDVFGLPREAPPKVPPHEFTLPEAFRPQGDDIVAQHAWQLHRLLERRGVDHIIYAGWALNWCLWFSPCGMADMSRKGYTCSAVRGGCVAIENRESAVGEGNLEYAFWKTSTMFGYVFDLHDLTSALRECAGRK